MSDVTLIVVSVFLLFANAFFVGAEFALIAARRTNIEPKVRAGSRSARMTLGAMENVSLMMAGAQLGITICSLGLGSLGEPAVAHQLEKPFVAAGMPDELLHPVSFIIAMTIVVFLHVVIGEMVPKNIALAGPDRSALVLAPVLVVVVRVLYPFLWVLNQFANLVLRSVKVTPKDEITSAFTRDEVAGLVGQSHEHGLLDSTDEQLLVSALTFEERDATSVMIPAADLVTIARSTTPAQVEELTGRTGYSRFPVQEPDGSLTGYVHVKDVLTPDATVRERPLRPDAVRVLPSVHAGSRLREVLATMQRTASHLARVTAEAESPQGGATTIGLVALQDVLKELVGEVREEAGRSLQS